MSPLYKQFSILKLSNIFKLEVTKFMSKIKNNNLPELFQNYFYSTTDIHKFATRQAGRHDFFLPRSSSKFAQNSIKVCGFKVWNSLPLLLREKVKLGKRTFIKPPKKIFDIFDISLLINNQIIIRVFKQIKQLKQLRNKN